MNAPPIISSPLVVTRVCGAGQQWMSPTGSPTLFRAKSVQLQLLQRSPRTISEGITLPFHISSSLSSLSSCTTPLSLRPQRNSCFKSANKSSVNKPMVNHSRRSITFDEVVHVRTVSYATSATRADRLWYQDSDYERFRTKISKLAILAKKYQQQHGKSAHLPGMEKWIMDDTFDTANSTNINSITHLRSQAIGIVLMEQFCQRQQGQSNQERISALYRLTSLRSQIMARERAAAIRIRSHEAGADDHDN
jgi:hypothetical protein